MTLERYVNADASAASVAQPNLYCSFFRLFPPIGGAQRRGVMEACDF